MGEKIARLITIVTDKVFLPFERCSFYTGKEMFCALNQMFRNPMAEKNPVGLVARNPHTGCLLNIGCAAKLLELDEESVTVETEQRFFTGDLNILSQELFLPTKVNLIGEVMMAQDFLKVNEDLLWGLFQEVCSQLRAKDRSFPGGKEMNSFHVGRAADILASYLSLDFFFPRQDILTEYNPIVRLFKSLSYVQRFLLTDKKPKGAKIPVRSARAETAGGVFRDRLVKIKNTIPERVFNELEKELEIFLRMSKESSEYFVRLNWLNFALDFFSLKETTDNQNLESVWKILDEDHYGLGEIKKRVFEELVIKGLNPQKKGAILCFVGPPGTGKTSIGCSIARAMGRKFIRMSLGAVRDEAQIRGHRRTYVGALPGEILGHMRRSGSRNPVFMIDEIDKIGKDQLRGNIDSALLEVLDPAQNFSFRDHYLDLDADLSKVMFITTANSLDDIAEPLRDRMEIIDFYGYVNEEKIGIAKLFLIPKQLKEHGLESVAGADVNFPEERLAEIINAYTRESGVRELERQIGTILRKIAVEICTGNASGDWVIDSEKIKKFLGQPKNLWEKIKQEDVGTALGVAVSLNGGDVLKIKTLIVNANGNGYVEVTGSLGPVLEESVKIALSLIRSRIKTKKTAKLKNDLHLHVGDGGTSKDGPSAGAAIFCSLYSRFKNRPVRFGVVMTGEIDLSGNVLRIGGVKEKAIAAEISGATDFILPKGNESDLETLSESVKRKIRFRLVENIDEVLRVAF